MAAQSRSESPQADLLQGTLDVLVLKALALEPLHGMGISRRIAQLTRGTFDVKAGSLFPALHRMEESGWLVLSLLGPVEEFARGTTTLINYFRTHQLGNNAGMMI